MHDGDPRVGTAAAIGHGMGHEDFRDLRNRAFHFAVDVVLFCRTLPANREGRRTGDQLFRSGTAVGANYRAAGRSRSPRDFISKLGTVVEEADESCFWFELIRAAKISCGPDLNRLAAECEQLLKIFTRSLMTAKANQKRRKQDKKARKRKTKSPPASA
jgi:four helix bundle protein